MQTPLIPKSTNFQKVYEPAEDTYLLLDALELDMEFLRSSMASVALEIGSGSGCVISFLAQHLNRPCFFMASDINHYAAETTLKTSKLNNVNIDVVEISFQELSQSRLIGFVDILLFNPPYVVTSSEELGTRTIEASWAGGKDGREIIDQFLPLIQKFLSPKGVVYLVVVNENNPQDILDQCLGKYNLAGEVLMYRKAGIEGLSILKMRFV